MFTGLIENTAVVLKRTVSGKKGKLLIKCSKPFSNLKIGESIAVNGACLTLETIQDDTTLEFHVLAETFKCTNLGTLNIGGKLNLERALAFGDRLGGHLVSGHVDAVGEIIELRKNADDMILKVQAPDAVLEYLVPKGSIAIDGVSLTLVEIGKNYFSVHLIPLTLNETALGERAKKQKLVNLEADLIGKYVKNQVGNMLKSNSNISMDTLRKAGF